MSFDSYVIIILSLDQTDIRVEFTLDRAVAREQHRLVSLCKNNLHKKKTETYFQNCLFYSLCFCDELFSLTGGYKR